LGFRLRPLGFDLLRGLSVDEDSSSLGVLFKDGVEGLDESTGLGPDNFNVIFKGEEAICKYNILDKKRRREHPSLHA
jgi:hypothetical protein